MFCVCDVLCLTLLVLFVFIYLFPGYNLDFYVLFPGKKKSNFSSKKSGKGKRPGKGGNRFWKSVGLGFKTPREAIEGPYFSTIVFMSFYFFIVLFLCVRV